MKSSIESLESRRLFSTATVDFRAMTLDQQKLPAVFNTISAQQSAVRTALHTDLTRLHLLKANAASLVTLSRDESNALGQLKNDVYVLDLNLILDGRALLIRARNFHQHPNSSGLQADFSTAVAKFDQDEENEQSRLTTDLTTTAAKTTADLNAIAAIDSADFILQSDVQSGISNLTNSASKLQTAVSVVTGDATTYLADSSNVAFYGSANLFATGYPSKANPFGGALVSGLGANQTSVATIKYVAPTTFAPAVGAYPGTDQIYVGSDETPGTDQIAGPQVINVNYGSLTKLAHPIKSLTLGIATDGFENPTINIPYTVSINGVVNTALTTLLNSLNDADRVEQYVSIGIDPTTLSASQTLTISIDGPGDGVSGWAVDFVTVGVVNG